MAGALYQTIPCYSTSQEKGFKSPLQGNNIKIFLDNKYRLYYGKRKLVDVRFRYFLNFTVRPVL